MKRHRSRTQTSEKESRDDRHRRRYEPLSREDRVTTLAAAGVCVLLGASVLQPHVPDGVLHAAAWVVASYFFVGIG